MPLDKEARAAGPNRKRRSSMGTRALEWMPLQSFEGASASPGQELYRRQKRPRHTHAAIARRLHPWMEPPLEIRPPTALQARPYTSHVTRRAPKMTIHAMALGSTYPRRSPRRSATRSIPSSRATSMTTSCLISIYAQLRPRPRPRPRPRFWTPHHRTMRPAS